MADVEITPPPAGPVRRVEVEGPKVASGLAGPVTLAHLRAVVEAAAAEGCPDAAIVKSRMIAQTFLAGGVVSGGQRLARQW
jgi:hypothetical protein